MMHLNTRRGGVLRSRPLRVAGRNVLAGVALLAAVVALPVARAGGSEPLTSRLTGVALPAGAERVEDADTAAKVQGQLDALAREKGMRARNVELLAWSGKGGSADALSVVDAVESKMKAGGWVLQSTEPQTSDRGRVTSFAGLNEAKKAGLIGFWLANEKMLLLAWADLVSASATAEGPPLETRMPDLPKLEPKPGFVRGRVVNMRGEPLPNAAVLVYGTTFAGGRTQAYPIAAQDGAFEIEVPDGLYDVSATTKVRYHDADYRLELFPMDGSAAGQKANSKTGIVKDFALKPTGRSSHYEAMGPDYAGSYNGGSIAIRQRREVSIAQTGELPAGVITVTLEPQGPLIDGSTIGVLRTNVDFAKVFTGAWYDVPVGRYRASATIALAEDGKTYALQVVVTTRRSDAAPPPAASAVFDFAPRTGADAGTEEVAIELRR